MLLPAAPLFTGRHLYTEGMINRLIPTAYFVILYIPLYPL